MFKKSLYIIIVVFALSFLFITGNTIKSYRTLKREIGNELLSEVPRADQDRTSVATSPYPAVADEKIEEVAEEASSEETAIAALSILPHFDSASGKFSGLKIDNIQKGSIIERAGLRNGDIIKVVNDQKLTSSQRAIQIFRKAQNQSKIGVNLLRKNRVVSLKYKIKD